jgi:xanthine dehydrogenase YagS FAD-binding subunit
MENFAYARARGAAEAVAAAGRDGATFLAGGTELLNWMRLGVAAPARVIDIARADELRFIRASGARIGIGALSTLNEIGEHDAIVRDCPVLAQACLKAASAQIRNLATIGGNILQKTRCAYFRVEGELPWPCNKRQPGTGCAARDGENRNHAIFGWSNACVATQPSDPAVALAALDAAIHVRSASGTRVIPAAELHRLPGDDPGRDNVLEPGELITHIDIPQAAEARGSFYLKVRERESYEYATVAVAAIVKSEAGRITAARIVLGSVAHKPWRVPAAEQALIGAQLDPRELDAAVRPAFADARPLTHNAFKIELARRAVVRALLHAGGAA